MNINKKARNIIKSLIYTIILALGLGFILTGCSSMNNTLQKEHIMNDGCFITCYNNYGNKNNYNELGNNQKKLTKRNAISKIQKYPIEKYPVG